MTDDIIIEIVGKVMARRQRKIENFLESEQFRPAEEADLDHTSTAAKELFGFDLDHSYYRLCRLANRIVAQDVRVYSAKQRSEEWIIAENRWFRQDPAFAGEFRNLIVYGTDETGRFCFNEESGLFECRQLGWTSFVVGKWSQFGEMLQSMFSGKT